MVHPLTDGFYGPAVRGARGMLVALAFTSCLANRQTDTAFASLNSNITTDGIQLKHPVPSFSPDPTAQASPTPTASPTLDPKQCPQGNSCILAGTVDPVTGGCVATAKPDGTACDDNDACTQSATCQQGVCTANARTVCTDLDACRNLRACNASYGCGTGGQDTCDTRIVSVPLLGCNFGGYRAKVQVGSGNTVNLRLATFFPATTVVSSGCTTCGNVAPVYLPSTQGQKSTVRASYPFGTSSGWAGYIWRDDVDLGGPVPEVNMKFDVVDNQAGYFLGSSCDVTQSVQLMDQGVLSMVSKERAADIGADSYIERLASTNEFANVFSVHLQRVDGQLWLGGIEPQRDATKVQYTPLLSGTKDWSVGMQDLRLGNIPLTAAGTGYYIQIVSEAYTLGLPPLMYSALVSQLYAHPAWPASFGKDMFPSVDCAGNCPYNCRTTPGLTEAVLNATLPKLTITVPGVGNNPSFTITLDATHSYLWPSVAADGTTFYCANLANQEVPNVVSWGALPMNNMTTVFNAQARAVGFLPD